MSNINTVSHASEANELTQVGTMQRNPEGHALEVCTATEAAKALRISIKSVYRLIKDGRLKSINSFFRHRIPKESIAALIGYRKY